MKTCFICSNTQVVEESDFSLCKKCWKSLGVDDITGWEIRNMKWAAKRARAIELKRWSGLRCECGMPYQPRNNP